MSDLQNDGYYEALWPGAKRQQQGKALAPRLASLEGKTIAHLWDYLFRGDEIFEALGAAADRALPRHPFRELARIRQHARPR